MTEPHATRTVPVARIEELPEGTMLLVHVDATPILLVHRAGIHALQGICSHETFELDRGFLTGDAVTCALHLSRFDLATGEALDPPAMLPLVRYPVAVTDDGAIVLTLPAGPIPVNEE